MNELMNEQMNSVPVQGAAQAPVQAPADEVTVDELEGNLTQGAVQEEQIEDVQDEEEMVERIREGLGELFEDGWSPAEIQALTEDETVRHAIAQGHSVARAACAYLRAMNPAQAMHRHAVPTARTTAAGSVTPDNRIEHMTDAQFDAFSRKARAAMMAGKRVRMD